MSKLCGYLVVLKSTMEILKSEFPPHYQGRWNTRYQGIDRMPAYYFPHESPFPEENLAMDLYVFSGNYKDDNGLIPSLSKAQELLKMFLASSRREFEIIYVETCDDEEQTCMELPNMVELGYDVAGEAPFYSHVFDFPRGEDFKGFFESLNEHGLFGSVHLAREFLSKCVALGVPDIDDGVRIWRIFRVVPAKIS